jgi:hypothetical protein
VPKKSGWVAAGEATRMLGISRATLYAYVSRGFLRSEPVPGRSRERRYAREDVERLRMRAEERRNPEKAAAHALRWGVPILESAITLIADGKLYYRGHDATELARTRSLEDVAALIWTGSFDADVFDTPLHVISGGSSAANLPFIKLVVTGGQVSGGDIKTYSGYEKAADASRLYASGGIRFTF